MAKRKTKPSSKPDEATTGSMAPMPAPAEAEEEIFSADPTAGAADASTTKAIERLIRGLGALHESFKQYKKQTDAHIEELKNIIEGVAKRRSG